MELQTENPDACIVDYGHVPRYNSGEDHRAEGAGVDEIWDLLVSYGADLYLAGHEHGYERFAKEDDDDSENDAVDDADGMRQVVVGSGGRNHAAEYGTNSTEPEVLDNSQAVDAEWQDVSGTMKWKAATHGVLELTLHPDSYDLEFVPDTSSGFEGAQFTDGLTGVEGNE